MRSVYWLVQYMFLMNIQMLLNNCALLWVMINKCSIVVNLRVISHFMSYHENYGELYVYNCWIVSLFRHLSRYFKRKKMQVIIYHTLPFKLLGHWISLLRLITGVGDEAMHKEKKEKIQNIKMAKNVIGESKM